MKTRWTLWMGAGMVVAVACSAPPDPGDDDDQNATGGGGSGGMPSTTTSSPPTTTATTSNPNTCMTTNITFNDAVCGDCAESNCCTELTACDTSQACVGYLGCVQQCTDQPCADQCATDNPGGEALLDDVDACLDTGCATECGGGGDNFPICDSGLAVNQEACATCLGDSCCDDVKACEADSSCMGCVTGDSAACEAGALDEAVRDCWNLDCMADCGAAGF